MDCASICDTAVRMHSNGSRSRPDQLFYRIMDALVDSYHPLLDTLSDRIDQMEDEAISSPQPALLEEVFGIRRSLIELRRILTNSRDVLGHLQRVEYNVIGRDLMPFLRDVYDHIIRNLDRVEMERDLLTSTTELYLSSVANRTNQVMKALTVFGALATPALIITGIYGMNLQHLPFAENPQAPAIVVALILGASGLLMLILKLLRWL
jgi:magnesium transporter